MTIGIITTILYIFYHSSKGRTDAVLVCILHIVFLVIMAIETYLDRFTKVHQNTMIFSYGGFVTYITYMFEIRGLVYIYPYIAIMFFAQKANKAFFISLFFAVLSLYAVSFYYPIQIVLGLCISITMTVIISFMYASKAQKHEKALTNEANKDYLTGEGNRRSIICWLRSRFRQLSQHSTVIVYYIDIDNFKRINDTYGHTTGDLVLQKISQQLKLTINNALQTSTFSYKLSRIAGDEFVIAIEFCNDVFSINEVANQLLNGINETILLDGKSFHLNACIGVSISKEKGTDSLGMVSNADQAMFKAKKQGKNHIAFFDEHLSKAIAIKNEIVISLKRAIDEGLFFLHFMPIYDKSASIIIGAEVLIRSNEAGLVKYDPDKYIPIAEEVGLMTKIDLMVIEKTFIAIRDILPMLGNRDFTFAINISAQELNSHTFSDDVLKLATTYNIPPHLVEFEITETSLVDYDDKSIHMLRSLKSQGYRLSLDDFGTGYTAFNQLQHYPVDTLKIDRSFVWNISKDKEQKGSMIEVILSLAKLYDLNVVAEGVEEQYQLDYLKELHCHSYQGYLLSKPIDLEMLKEKLS